MNNKNFISVLSQRLGYTQDDTQKLVNTVIDAMNDTFMKGDIVSIPHFGTFEVEKEESYGDRDLTYEVKKYKRGRFLLLVIKANPAKVVELNRQFKLNPDLLKCMFVKIDE